MKKPTLSTVFFITFSLMISAQEKIKEFQPLELPLRGESGEIILGLGVLYGMAYSPGGHTIATWGNIGVYIWDIETSQIVRWFPSYTDYAAYSPDGSRLFTYSRSADHVPVNTATMWNLETAQIIWTTTTNMDAEVVVFSPDGNQVLTGSDNGTVSQVTQWDAEASQVPSTYSGHIDQPTSTVYSPDGNQVLIRDETVNLSDTVNLCDTQTGQVFKTFCGHTDLLYSVAFSPDGSQIIAGYVFGHNAKLWDVLTGKSLRTFSCTSVVESVAFSPDWNNVLTVDRNGIMTLWDKLSGEEIWTYSNNQGNVEFSPDGTQVLTGSINNNAVLLDTTTGEVLHTFFGHSKPVKPVAFSSDGSRILTGSEDKTVKLWDVNTEQNIWTSSGNTGVVYSLAFSPDESRVFTGSNDNTVKSLNAQTGQEIQTRTLVGCDGITSMTFSPDARWLLVGSYDNTAKLWNALTGQLLRTFSGHGSVDMMGDETIVNSVAFSPDMTQILTGGWDGTARIWDISDLTQLTSNVSDFMIYR